MHLYRELLMACSICALATATALAQGSTSPGTSPRGTNEPNTSSGATMQHGASGTGTTGSGSTDSSHRMGSDSDSKMGSGNTGSGSGITGSGGGPNATMGSGSTPSRDMRSGRTSSGSNDVRRVQEALKAQGHDPGPIDGVMGQRTQQAIREYQDAQKIESTGRIDRQTREKLGIGRTSFRQ